MNAENETFSLEDEDEFRIGEDYMLCDGCKGTGYVEDLIDMPDGSESTYESECVMCGGTGYAKR